jgi:hypothetical protein
LSPEQIVTAERRVSDARLVWYLQGMGSSGLKQKIVETVEHLPDDATVEDAMERLYFLAKIERGLAESEAGDTISHEDVRKRFLG